MRLFERFGRLLKADAHGVIDSLEERSLLLKQHLREAELAVARKRAKADALQEEKKSVEREARDLEVRLLALDEDVELALAAGKEELARFAVRQLLPKRRVQTTLAGRIVRLAERCEELLEELPDEERELCELRSRVRVQLAAAATRVAAPDALAPAVADEEVELELLRRREAAATGAA